MIVYNTSFVYCREMAPGTVSSTGDWVRGDDSEQYTEVLKHLVENIVVLKSKDCHRLHQ